MDFSIAKLPGWHSTIFPPYFVAGAIFSGFAMVAMLLVPLRKLYRLETFITPRHFDLMGKLMLVTGLIVGYSYVCEVYNAWYSASDYERHMALFTRPLGPYAVLYWLMLFCNVAAPQALWFRKVRRSGWALWTVAVLIQVGMWVERFVLIVTSEHQDYLPSSWDIYTPSVVDGAIFFGSVGFFMLLLIGMMRVIPWVSIAETKELQHELRLGASDG